MLACGHDRQPFGNPMCSHLRTCRAPWMKYVGWLIGTGLEMELLCVPCSDAREGGETVAVDAVCEECYQFATSEVGDLTGTKGKPEIRERLEEVHSSFTETPLPKVCRPVIDIAAHVGEQRSVWFTLCANGAIGRLDAESGEWNQLALSQVPPESEHTPWNNRRSGLISTSILFQQPRRSSGPQTPQDV